MPYDGDGFYYEEACHGKDAERRFHRAERSMEEAIAKLDRILRNRRIGTRREFLTNWRNNLLAELHEHRQAGARYDARHRAAMDDPTGQDLDAFYGDH